MTTPRPEFSAPTLSSGTPTRRGASAPQPDATTRPPTTPGESTTASPYRDDTENGTVRWFDADKGYGFIRRDSTGGDVFVHHAEILSDGYRTLEPAQRVRFEIDSGPKGLRALRVEPL